MRYGESAFDILYLWIAIVSGIYILKKRTDTKGRLMGSSVLILGIGDAFHLVPRVLNYFVEADFNSWLGMGKCITSITMTIFYVCLYMLYLKLYHVDRNARRDCLIYILATVRVMVCLLPQNRWLENESSVLWGTLRNIPFVMLGALIVMFYFQKRKEIRAFRDVWLYVTLSFLFYIPVAVGAGILPILGMLMLPKTICYILLIGAFVRYIKDGETSNGKEASRKE
ncbi:MAG: hypothetical protein IJV50_01290 [Lachnospiraceae bacterium]|nr:hypothetical protein [Lachnospiraceae bacterium]